MAQREATDNKAGGGFGGARTTTTGRVVVVALETGGGAGEQRSAAATAATWACVACVGLAGAAVLVWWAVAFHPARQQLWMVPVGLVLLGTPLLAWLSLLASGASRWLGRIRRDHHQPPVRPDPES